MEARASVDQAPSRWFVLFLFASLALLHGDEERDRADGAPQGADGRENVEGDATCDAAGRRRPSRRSRAALPHLGRFGAPWWGTGSRDESGNGSRRHAPGVVRPVVVRIAARRTGDRAPCTALYGIEAGTTHSADKTNAANQSAHDFNSHATRSARTAKEHRAHEDPSRRVPALRVSAARTAGSESTPRVRSVDDIRRGAHDLVRRRPTFRDAARSGSSFRS